MVIDDYISEQYKACLLCLLVCLILNLGICWNKIPWRLLFIAVGTDAERGGGKSFPHIPWSPKEEEQKPNSVLESLGFMISHWNFTLNCCSLFKVEKRNWPATMVELLISIVNHGFALIFIVNNVFLFFTLGYHVL